MVIILYVLHVDITIRPYCKGLQWVVTGHSVKVCMITGGKRPEKAPRRVEEGNCNIHWDSCSPWTEGQERERERDVPTPPRAFTVLHSNTYFPQKCSAKEKTQSNLRHLPQTSDVVQLSHQSSVDLIQQVFPHTIY